MTKLGRYKGKKKELNHCNIRHQRERQFAVVKQFNFWKGMRNFEADKQ